MKDQVYNIAEAKTHLSRLIERVERGEQITIARNNRPVAIVSKPAESAQSILEKMDALRERIRAENGGKPILEPGETWHDLIDEGRRI